LAVAEVQRGLMSARLSTENETVLQKARQEPLLVVLVKIEERKLDHIRRHFGSF